MAVKPEPGHVTVKAEPSGGGGGEGVGSDGLVKRKAAAAAKSYVDDDTSDDENKPLSKRVKVENGAPKAVAVNDPKHSAKLKERAEALRKKKLVEQSKKAKLKGKDTGKKTKKVVVKKSAVTKAKSPKSGEGEGEKWKTLEHGGVLFPPEYEPHGVKMKYDGREVELTAAEEEVATMFAVMSETDYFTKPKFRENFWADFRQVLRENSGKHTVMKDLEKCDFSPISEHFKAKKDKEKEERSKLTAEDRKRLKAEKDEAEKQYKTALVDGKVEQVGNFRVEPPGLFRGRGEHPKMGKLKRRVYPRDIIINIGHGAKVPEVPAVYSDQRWKEVRHDNSVTWLAFWKDPVNNSQYKYVWLAATSSFKTDADLQKYEKARKLKDYVEGIRAKYHTLARAKDYKSKQMGTAMYFIDRLALRAGHEKDEDEADTVGCCNLKVDNVELMEDLTIKFDFLGKDSIRYENSVQVEEVFYKNVGLFKKAFQNKHKGRRKVDGDDLFCELDAGNLNSFLKEQMEGLSVKVFRTYNASVTLDRLLSEPDADLGRGGLVDSKVAAYNLANREVAVLCNHQRAVPKTHDASMEKLKEKQEKANAELAELRAKFKEAKKSKDDKAMGGLTTKIHAKEQAIQKMGILAKNREDLKTVALGTSKINYLDPRITVAWCKRNEVPIEKVFNRALFTKFLWAMDCSPDFRF